MAQIAPPIKYKKKNILQNLARIKALCQQSACAFGFDVFLVPQTHGNKTYKGREGKGQKQRKSEEIFNMYF